MDLSSAVYAYHFSNVASGGFPTDFTELAVLAVLVGSVFFANVFGPFLYAFALQIQKDAERARGKKRINELRAIKELQTEFEREVHEKIMNGNMPS